MPSQLLTLKEVAELLRVSKARVYRLIHRGQRLVCLPAIKRGGKWFVERDQIDEWLLEIWEEQNAADGEHRDATKQSEVERLKGSVVGCAGRRLPKRGLR